MTDQEKRDQEELLGLPLYDEDPDYGYGFDAYDMIVFEHDFEVFVEMACSENTDYTEVEQSIREAKRRALL